ncbi:MAG: hypothetical protein QM756_37930 [Polyangiaceae bacterium]
MKRPTHDENERIERLLAGGYLSGSQYDAIEQRVLAHTAKRQRGQLLRWVAPAALAASSMAALVAFWVRTPSTFTPKGTDTSLGVIDISCNRPLRHECAAGETLAFLVNSAVGSGYLGGYAERVGDSRHDRIWYFPNARGDSPYVKSGSQTIVLPEGIRIGSEHQPGQYRVSLWLSVRPLSRAEIEHADPSVFTARVTLTNEVVP